MSATFDKIIKLVAQGAIRISAHGYDELSDDNISVREIMNDINNALVVEDYPEYPKGPCVLVFQRDRNGKPLHIVWGIPRDQLSPAVLVTAYRPDPARWSEDFLRRRL